MSTYVEIIDWGLECPDSEAELVEAYLERYPWEFWDPCIRDYGFQPVDCHFRWTPAFVQQLMKLRDMGVRGYVIVMSNSGAGQEFERFELHEDVFDYYTGIVNFIHAEMPASYLEEEA